MWLTPYRGGHDYKQQAQQTLFDHFCFLFVILDRLKNTPMHRKNKIAILLFHPLFHKSRVNHELIRSVEGIDGITLRKMYDLYPDYHIQAKAEQEILVEHDIIVWQHPFYWYSSPSLLKEWIDIVLEHGFAYGKEGKALKGKRIMTSITAGGRREVYREGGLRNFTIRQLLAPFEQTARLCHMTYLPPFVVHGTHMLNEKGISDAGREYRHVMQSLHEGTFDPERLYEQEYINDLIT
jgi:glutathione-regulated potassium-efflux system ancillary protein KefG